MKNKWTQGILIFTLALLIGFYGSSAYHKQKTPDPRAYEEKLLTDKLDRRYQTENTTHPIRVTVNNLGLGEKEEEVVAEVTTPATKDTQDTKGADDTSDIVDINKETNKKEILTQWDKEWRSLRPMYKNQVVISIYIVDPTGSEMWQVASPKDGEEIIKQLDLVQLVEAPEAGMDLGFMLITEEKRLHVYVSDSPETTAGKSIREAVAPMKGRSLQSVDLFQLILNDQIKNLSFTAYLPNEEGSLKKVSINSADTEEIEKILKEFRKMHVSTMDMTSNASSLAKEMEPSVGLYNYHLVLDLGSPYEEGSKMEIVGTPLSFFAEFTPQADKIRIYTVDSTATAALLDTLKGFSFATEEVVPQPEAETTESLTGEVTDPPTA